MKRKIGILVGYNLYPNAKKFILNMNRMFDQKYKIDIIGNIHSEELCDLNIEVFWYKNYNNIFISYFMNSYIYMKKNNPSIMFHINNIVINGSIILVLSKLFRIPCIIRHSGYEKYFYCYDVDGLFKKISLFLMRKIFIYFPLLFSNYIISLGPVLAKEITNKYTLNKIYILPQPVYIEKKQIEIKNIIKSNDILINNKIIILFIGRLNLTKGADITLNIIKQLINDEKYKFIIIGEGNYRQYYEKIKSPNIILIKKVNINEIYALYNVANLLLLPSRSEGLPNVIIEALYFGVPVLASGVGEIPSLTTNIATEPEEYVRMIKNNKYIANEFPKKYLLIYLRKKYIKFINEVIKKGKY